MHIDNIQKLHKMLELQQALNDETNGTNWKKGIAKNGKIINWHRCIYMGAAEFVNSLPAWKHWKDIDAEPNIENAKIELVDIWHFLLSEILRVDYQKHIDNLYKHVIVVSYSQYTHDEEYENIIKMAEEMINEATKYCPNMNAILFQFFNTCAMVGLSFDELYIKYLGKNILNKFRQDNGYKDGTYIKIWNGREDNGVMLEIIQSNPNSTSEEFFELFNEEYNKVRSER